MRETTNSIKNCRHKTTESKMINNRIKNGKMVKILLIEEGLHGA